MVSLAIPRRKFDGGPASEALQFGSAPRLDIPRLNTPIEQAGSLSELWQILWHRRKWIALSVIVLCLGALTYCLLTPPQYTATAEIIIDPRDKQILAKDINPSALAPDGGIAQVDSQLQVLKSDIVLRRVITSLQLTKYQEFNGKSLLSHWTGAHLDAADLETRTLMNLKRQLKVTRADKVLVVDVTATARAPNLAANIANGVVDAYILDQAEANRQANEAATKELSARLSVQKLAVEKADDEVQQYKAEKHIISASGNLVSDQQLTTLSTELEAAKARTTNLRIQVDQLAQSKRGGRSNDATAEALQSSTIAKLREQESTLVQRAADLRSQLGPRHPAIAAIQQQLTGVSRMIASELGRISKAATADYARSLANQRQLSEGITRLKTQNLATNQDFVKLRELERTLDADRSVYSAFLLRANETREQAGVNSTDARIITRAPAPLQKSWPSFGILLAGALFSGFGIGSTGVLIKEYIKPTVFSIGQAEGLTSAPVIGVLPSANGKRGSEFEPAAWMALHQLFDMGAASTKSRMAPSLLIAASASDASECDQTTLAIATLAARAGERVLFIDTGTSSVTDRPAPGLIEVLRGECNLRQVTRFVRESGLYRVDLGQPLGALHSRSAKTFAIQMLMDAGRRFDLVIINAGDLRQNTNLAPLLSVVDEVVLLATLKFTQQSHLAALNETAIVMGHAPRGVLLTDEVQQTMFGRS